jgi:cell division protein FtsQ
MRKKSKRSNSRKFRLKHLFSRSGGGGETDWFRFDEGATPTREVSPRKRIRRRLLAARLTAFACLSVSLPLAAKKGYDHVFHENEEFVLQSLEIQTDGSLSVARLAEIANVAPGMNLLELDLGLVQEQISGLPQVERVSVSRELPDRLRILVRERMPVAWLSSPPLGIRPWDMERGFLLDETGHLFRCLDLNDGVKSLPVVESFRLAEPVEGVRIASDGVRSALKLILESDRRLLGEGIAVREVRLREEWAMECDYSTGLKATFGIYDFARGLSDLALILDRMASAGKVITSVNLAVERNIPVTFAAVEPLSQSPGTTPGEPSSQDGEAVANGGIELTAQEKHLRSILKGG